MGRYLDIGPRRQIISYVLVIDISNLRKFAHAIHRDFLSFKNGKLSAEKF